MTDEERAAISKSGGNPSVIASKLGVERSEVIRRIADDKEFARACDEEQQRVIDACMAKLTQAAASGDARAAARLLRMRERNEIEQNRNGYIHVLRAIMSGKGEKA